MHLPPFSFFLSLFSVGLGCAHGSRNSVEYARRRDFDTLCSASEGSVRRFHEARFLSPRVLRLFPSSSRTQKRTLLPVYKRTSINVTPVVVSLVCGSCFPPCFTETNRTEKRCVRGRKLRTRVPHKNGEISNRAFLRAICARLVFVQKKNLCLSIYSRRLAGVFPRKRLRLRCATTVFIDDGAYGTRRLVERGLSRAGSLFLSLAHSPPRPPTVSLALARSAR